MLNYQISSLLINDNLKKLSGKVIFSIPRQFCAFQFILFLHSKKCSKWYRKKNFPDIYPNVFLTPLYKFNQFSLTIIEVFVFTIRYKYIMFYSQLVILNLSTFIFTKCVFLCIFYWSSVEAKLLFDDQDLHLFHHW